jgi:hypothetical protein
MIGHFPQPYPDELFYSICARFSERMQYRYPGDVMAELFGTPGAWASIGFPRHLNYLVEALPPGQGYTIDTLIDAHTLLPFYAPFIPPGRLAQVREQMQTQVPGQPAYARILNRRMTLPDQLRFCPLCVEEDRTRLGECYWHRLHQAPGIYVCPAHRTLLEPSDAHTQHPAKSKEFISAESTVRPGQLRRLDSSNSCHQVLMEIAHDVAWLFNQHCLSPDLGATRNRYINLLMEHGFATHSGRVGNWSKLIQAFNAYYPPELLTLLHCEPERTRHWHWLFGLLRQGQIQPPVCHLLLIHFLGHTLQTFFELPGERRYSDSTYSQPTQKQANPELRDKYRAIWLSAMKDHPEAGTGKLAHMDLRVYIWLWYYDRAWLNLHKPPPQTKKGKPSGPRVDWKERDTQLAEQVRQSAQRLVNLPGRPIRVTATAIERDIGIARLLSSESRAKLPLTAHALSEVTDSYETLAVRRIQWTVNQYRLEEASPTRMQLIGRAGIFRPVLPPQVKQALDAALKTLIITEGC